MNSTSASYASASTSASYALNATSASYITGSNVIGIVSNATSASYALNGGVTQLLAGPNITISPLSGKGQVTISSTGTGSGNFNTATGSYGSFYDTTTQTNPVANVPRSMSFNETAITNGVSISGSTNPFNTYIKTEDAGVYNIQFSAQIDKTDSGEDNIDIWIRKNGIDLIDTATSLTLPKNNNRLVAAWNWFVQSATNDYYQIIWSSADTSMRLLAEVSSSAHPGIPSVILTANRVDQFLSNTGSFNGDFNGAFTGSLAGTSSYATTASYAINATSASYALNTTTASYALTASSADSFTVRGTLTAQTINVQIITSSVDFVTGSTHFGTIIDNTHQFTGSVSVSGSLAVNNSNVILTNQTSSMSVATASYVQNAVSASYVQTAQTASYWSGSIINAATASYVENAQTASYVLNAVSASYAASASNALAAQTASYVVLAQTASFTPNAIVTASVNISTITFTKGDNSTFDITVSQSGSVATASYAIFAESASNAVNAQTASYVTLAQTASYVLNALSSSFASTASYVQNAQSASYVLSSSYALSASQADNAISSSFTSTASFSTFSGIFLKSVLSENSLAHSPHFFFSFFDTPFSFAFAKKC